MRRYQCIKCEEKCELILKTEYKNTPKCCPFLMIVPEWKRIHVGWKPLPLQ